MTADVVTPVPDGKAIDRSVWGILSRFEIIVSTELVKYEKKPLRIKQQRYVDEYDQETATDEVLKKEQKKEEETASRLSARNALRNVFS